MTTDKYQTQLKRLAAAIVDAIVFVPFLFVDHWIHKMTNNISILFVWISFISFASLIYSIILHYKYGQTIGKWVVGVKVLDISETRKLTLTQSIYRDSFYVLIFFAGVAYYGFVLTQSKNNQDIIADYASFSNYPVFLWTAIELVTMLTNPKRRAVHDFLAKSVVIRIEKN